MVVMVGGIEGGMGGISTGFDSRISCGEMFHCGDGARRELGGHDAFGRGKKCMNIE